MTFRTWVFSHNHWTMAPAQRQTIVTKRLRKVLVIISNHNCENNFSSCESIAFKINKLVFSESFLKGQSQPLFFIFVLFKSQFNYKLKISVDVTLIIRTRGIRMEGADWSTDLWHRILLQSTGLTVKLSHKNKNTWKLLHNKGPCNREIGLWISIDGLKRLDEARNWHWKESWI